jgi:hypothetical protein
MGVGIQAKSPTAVLLLAMFIKKGRGRVWTSGGNSWASCPCGWAASGHLAGLLQAHLNQRISGFLAKEKLS